MTSPSAHDDFHTAPLWALVKGRLHQGRSLADNVKRLRWRRKRPAKPAEPDPMEPSEPLMEEAP